MKTMDRKEVILSSSSPDTDPGSGPGPKTESAFLQPNERQQQPIKEVVPTSSVVLHMDRHHPQMGHLQQQLEKNGFTTTISTQASSSAEDLKTTVQTIIQNKDRQINRMTSCFVVVDHSLAQQQNMSIPLLRQWTREHEQIFLIVVFSPFFSKSMFYKMNKEQNENNRFLYILSATWDIEVLCFIKHVDHYYGYRQTTMLYKQEKETLALQVRRMHQALHSNALRIKQLRHDLEKMVIYDPLTSLDTNHSFELKLIDIMKEAYRHKDNICLVYAYIDNHEQILEVYGEDGRDSLIVQISALIKRHLRPGDVASINLHKNTFWVLYKRIQGRSARATCYRLKSHIENKTFYYQENNKLHVSISIGASVAINYQYNTYDYKEMIDRASIALNNALKKGINSVVFYA